MATPNPSAETRVARIDWHGESVGVCTCGREFSAHDMIANSRKYITGSDYQKFYNLNRARAERHAKACGGHQFDGRPDA